MQAYSSVEKYTLRKLFKNNFYISFYIIQTEKEVFKKKHLFYFDRNKTLLSVHMLK